MSPSAGISDQAAWTTQSHCQPSDRLRDQSVPHVPGFSARKGVHIGTSSFLGHLLGQGEDLVGHLGFPAFIIFFSILAISTKRAKPSRFRGASHCAHAIRHTGSYLAGALTLQSSATNDKIGQRWRILSPSHGHAFSKPKRGPCNARCGPWENWTLEAFMLHGHIYI